MKILGNPYVLGFLMILVEACINLVAGFVFVSGIVLSFAAGYIYSWQHAAAMPKSAKFKLLFVYLGCIALLTLFIVSFTEGQDLGFRTLLLIAVGVGFIYGLFMYIGLTFGSSTYLKMLENKRSAENQPEVT